MTDLLRLKLECNLCNIELVTACQNIKRPVKCALSYPASEGETVSNATTLKDTEV